MAAVNDSIIFPLVGSIDEGTSSTRFMIFSPQTSNIVAEHQISIKSYYPKEGWCEQDPKEIVSAVLQTIEEACKNLQKLSLDIKNIAAIGITNQRETTVVWDPETGEPLHHAIVWLDVRTSVTTEKLLNKVPNRSKNHIQPLCGLPISTYFSAVKLRWLMDYVPKVAEAIKNKKCMFGTIDSWLMWNLTGGVNGGLHITDVTNASRTMLMNVSTLEWDPELCKFFDIPMHVLPKICSSSEIYGHLSVGCLKGVPISGILGDQHAALLGQMCLKEGQAKNTYGTGCFLLYNTGYNKVISKHGLLTTVAWKLGNQKQVYALEGSVAIAGEVIKWLRDNLKLISSTSEVESLASRVMHTGDVYFIPAFSGLYAPYWQSDARGIICGLTDETEKGHIIRAALEAICFQTRDVLEAMHKDCGIPLTRLRVDGGMTQNNLLMQLQADLVGIPVYRPKMAETTALGAAIAAGYAEGVKVWDIENTRGQITDRFLPVESEQQRNERYAKWKMAIERSMGWETLTDV